MLKKQNRVLTNDVLSSAVVAVVEALELRQLLAGDPTIVQTLPFALEFNAPVAGTIADNAAQGTGFTWVQPNKNGNEYQPALLNLQTGGSGVLNITTTGTSTNGGPWEADNSQVDALQTQWNASTSGAVTITTRLLGPLSNLAASAEQGGIIFGPDQDNYIKFVAENNGSGTGGQKLQFVDEQLPSGATSYTHSIPTASSYTVIGSFSSITTLDLQMTADPNTGTVTGAYAVNGGAFVTVAQSVTLTGAEKTAFFSSTARAGIMTMAKNSLAPITVGFDRFAIAAVQQPPPPTGTKLTGAIIGTAGSYNNAGNTIAKAFDGSFTTFFDAPSPGNGDWVGLDLGTPTQITQVQYAPRPSWAGRMVGGIFQGSSTADFSSGVVNLFTITATPPVGSFTAQAITDTGTYRYVRYLSPDGAHGNVAELEFDGITTVTPPPQTGPKLTGTVIGTPGSYNNSGNTIAKVFDGNLSTFFDAQQSDGAWAGLDLGEPNVIAQIKYAPRSGWASRMVGGIFQGSSTADFSSGVVNLYTVTTTPPVGSVTIVSTNNSNPFRYVRYLGPTGSHGNVAEVEFDNQVTSSTTNPSIASARPADGSINVARNAFVSCDLNLPNFAAGINVNTLTNTTVYLYRTFDHQLVDAALNTDGAGSVIVLQPFSPLDASTTYTFVVTSGLKDTSGATFQPFQLSFTTGSDPITTDPNIAFEKVALPTAVNELFTGVTMGPDGDLYASTLGGDIFQFPVNPDGTLGIPNDIQTVIKDPTNNGPRIITGIAFDPSSTPTNMILWVSHGSGIVYGAADFTGKISTLSGPGFSQYQDYVVGLPRSSQDHLNNQPVFGPDGALYWGQGSNSAMGAPDPVWGNRQEHLLNAAVLRLDVNAVRQRLANGLGPLNVQTDNLPAGQTAYNPYAAGAPLTIYATGLRNDYDLVFDDNGHLYAPTNGSAAGGNVPATPAGVTPSAPALNHVSVAEDDFLFDVVKGGYYGHPNPSRGEYIMDGGNPSTPLGGAFPIESAYPVGTNPDPNYRGTAGPLGDLGVHYSPDGSIEYKGSAFNGALNGALLITRYSGGDDILLARTAADGTVASTETGIAGFTGFNNPIDLTENATTGFIYVAELGAMKLTLLRPINSGSQATVSQSTFYFNDPVGGGNSPTQSLTITNTGNAPLALPADGLTVTGADGSLFPIVSKPTFPLTIPVGSSITVTLAFNPASTTTLGIPTAGLQIKSNDPNNPIQTVSLRAIATSGIGGNNEPSLQRILDLYQIPDNVGTADPSKTQFTTPPLQPNDELTMPRLVKAGGGAVTITPLAVFSASITPSAGFGWYNAGTSDSLNQLFTFNSASAQTVDPTPIGTTSFDPGSAIFGLFASFDAFPDANGHARIAYSEDVFNTYDTSGNNRKVRFYPMRNPDGSVVPNTFIFATEDYGVAPSYDSNDVVGIISNVAAAPSGPEIGLTNQDVVPFPDRMTFNSIQNLNTQFPNVFHNQGTLRIYNTGDQPMSIFSIGSSNAAFTVGTTLTYPVVVQPGLFQDVLIKYAPTHTGVNASDSGTLTIQTNAVNTLTKTVQLAGFWQSYGNFVPGAGTYTEPSVSQIVSLFGYGTKIINAGQNMNQGGAIATVGEEVLSRYWMRADTNLPLTVRQLASFHTQGNKDTLYWFQQGSPTTYNTIVTAAGNDAQSFLPQSNDSTHAIAYGTAKPNGQFGFNIDKQENSDDTLNTIPAGSTTDQGHHMRFWPARDRNGNLIPNTWLMSMDYAGINYDYNDNDFLITNMRPAPPATPSGLTATGSGTGIALAWTPVVAPLLGGYNVYRSTSSTGTFSKIATVAAATFNDATATPGGTYYYKVSAIDTWGGESALSAAANATRPSDAVAPMAPAGLTPSATSSGITLNWTANTEPDLAGYNVYRSNAANGTFFKLNTASLITSPTYMDSSAPAGQASFYRVTAVDTSGNESQPATTNATRLVDTTPPAAPAGFGASGSTTKITLTWSANTEPDLAGYNLYRANSATGQFTKLNSTPLTSLTYSDTTAQLSFPSYYQLTAVDTSGNESGPTTANAVHKDTTFPGAPAGLGAVDSTGGIVLTWAANTEPDLAGYNVYGAPGASGPFTLLNVGGLLTSTTFTDATATPNATNYYRVSAVDFSGNESAFANTSQFHAGVDMTPPAQPSGFNATGSATGVALIWTANTEPDLAGYNLYRSSSAAGPFLPVNTTGLLTGTSYNDAGAPAGQTSFYELTAVDTSGNESTPATANAMVPAQTGFTSVDIGNPQTGSTTEITPNNAYDIQAGGTNIFGTADQFRFVYKQLTGNFDVKVQITSLSNGDGTTSGYARAGIMARTDLTAGSANIYTYSLAGPFGFLTTYRTTPGGNTNQTAGINNNGAQRWVRLVRVGDTFTSYGSLDGTTWTQISSLTISLGQTIYVGMATTSHEPDHLVKASYRNLSGL
jgi:fibronectin type 3 domain-containing protein